jgi:hypothetical protein
MRKKKDLPLVILKELESFVNLKGEKFEVIDPKANYLKVIDKDSDSEFHFTIEKYQKTNRGTFQFLMTRSPKSQNEIEEYQTWLEIAQLKGQFDAWIKLLEEYDSVNSFFDDPIINSFKDEFYAEFEIIDEDAETKPLNTKQILLLDSYLEKVNDKLDEYKTEGNSEEIQDIQDEIETLKENLTTKSKKWVVNRLTTIWAKIAKKGTKYIKEFLTESKKELIKQGVKGLIEFVKDNGTELLN